MNKDPYGSKKQFPSLMGNLKEDRSLADCITYTGRTTEFNTRNDAWQRGHGNENNVGGSDDNAIDGSDDDVFDGNIYS